MLFTTKTILGNDVKCDTDEEHEALCQKLKKEIINSIKLDTIDSGTLLNIIYESASVYMDKARNKHADLYVYDQHEAEAIYDALHSCDCCAKIVYGYSYSYPIAMVLFMDNIEQPYSIHSVTPEAFEVIKHGIDNHQIPEGYITYTKLIDDINDIAKTDPENIPMFVYNKEEK